MHPYEYYVKDTSKNTLLTHDKLDLKRVEAL
jgi:hypothetical protein